MLFNLHVKNLALIDETDVYFGDGLNILTGETGAGKSMIVGSINLALGQKFSKELLRKEDQDAFVELVFTLDHDAQRSALMQLGITAPDDQVVLTRRLSAGRSISKINGETANTAKLKEVAAILLDMHGQHEHQSLLYKKKHLEILDEYGRETIQPIREQVADAYRACQRIQSELQKFCIDKEERQRELSFLEFEMNEIEQAALTPGEDAEVEADYRRLSNGKRILECTHTVHCLTGYDSEQSAGEAIGRAVQEMQSVREFDVKLEQLTSQLEEIDGILNDFNRELSAYEQSQDFGEELFYETEKRLNELNHIKSKYGGSIERVLELYEEKKKRYAALQDYEQTLKRLKQESEEALKRYRELAERLSKERTAYAKALSEEIRKNLIDLNFLQVQFEMKVSPKDTITGNGSDEAEFFISTNPGEPLRSLGAVASGGELSRIMLAIKTVLAGKDTVGTLVFDEIDTGISGRTAQMVAEKMAVIAKQHQVICITHLPQIAAMADVHFQIEKTVQHGGTETVLTRLSDEQMIGELTRMLGGAKLTDAVKNSAEEMKRLAEHYKKKMEKTTKL